MEQPHPHLRKTLPRMNKTAHVDPTAFIDHNRKVIIKPWVCICAGVKIHGHYHIHNLEYQTRVYKMNLGLRAVWGANELFIGHHTWICEGAVILPQVDYIAPHTIIGANTVVTKNIKEPCRVVVGNPGRIVRKHDYDKVVR